MSRSSIAFSSSIEDATTLLTHFDNLHKQNADSAEVLKRAGLVMALTAWETYIEDRIQEAVQSRLKAVNGSPIGKFVESKLSEELKRFHNPNSEKNEEAIQRLSGDRCLRWLEVGWLRTEHSQEKAG